MNVAVAVKTSLGKELVLVGGGVSAEAVLDGVGPRGVSETRGMASLAELGGLSGKEVLVIAPVRLVTDHTVLDHRWMFEGEGSPLLLMAGDAEV